jgi:hypothetical protein
MIDLHSGSGQPATLGSRAVRRWARRATKVCACSGECEAGIKAAKSGRRRVSRAGEGMRGVISRHMAAPPMSVKWPNLKQTIMCIRSKSNGG